MLRAALALAFGLAVAAAVHTWGPTVAPIHVDLPTWIAARPASC